MSRSFTIHGRSATGRKRTENQDRFRAVARAGVAVLAIADGMGGAEGGSLAAEEAVAFLDGRIGEGPSGPQALVRLVREAGNRIAVLASQAGLEGMGTTMTVAVLAGAQAVWAHAGDSRLYLLRAGELRQITKDHRFLQELVDAGDISLEDLKRHPLRNVLDQCLGCPGLAPDCGVFALQFGDLIILTSDGVHDHVDSETLHNLLQSESDLSEIADSIITAALSMGSCDDLSVVLCRVAD